ncbi:MAG: hypothetical protein WAW85_06435, partial [Gordonia sp. (in: high G+C Gram-positive bacteria)]|uniref:hypothetical protein n=1 Tax=Gordonia sp. (in: high G+C Gram-positive bacteria) TaxID=84139 RepID=UPI003BB4B420
AQVRAVAEAQAEGALEALSAAVPRAVVITTGAGRLTSRAADFAVAACAGRLDVPIVVAPILPGWVGPLDVVVVTGTDAGDPLLADALSRAGRRHAEIVVAAPLEGPLRDAARIGERGAIPVLDLSPRLPVDPRFRFTGLVAALVAVFTGLHAVRLTPAPLPLAELADLLDAEAGADHPSQESFYNQAKLLALRASGHRPVFVGQTPAAAAVAAQVAAAFFDIAGWSAVSADIDRALSVQSARSVTGDATSALFYDPEFDGPPAAEPRRTFVLSTAARGWFAAQQISGHDADLITEQVGTDEAAAQRADGALDVRTDTPADIAAYLVIVVRAELAAAYAALGRERVGI